MVSGQSSPLGARTTVRGKNIMVEIIGIIIGALLSLAALAMLWIGHPAAMIVVVPLFSLASYAISLSRGAQVAILTLGTSALPLGMFVAMFRDPAGSHTLPVTMVTTWYVGIALGAVTARFCRTPIGVMLGAVAVISLIHGVLAALLAEAAPDIAATAYATTARDTAAYTASAARYLLEPGLSAQRLLPAGVPGLASLLFAMGSLTWGTGLAFAACWLLHLTPATSPTIRAERRASPTARAVRRASP